MTNEEALIQLIGRKEMDQNALTLDEIADKTGLSRSSAKLRMKDAVDSGSWEQVCKKQENGRVVQAYRVKRERE